MALLACKMSMPYFALIALALLSLTNATALPQDGDNPVVCPFNETVGPQIMLAHVTLPDGTTEIDAWIYSRNWCSEANLVSTNPDICDLPPSSGHPVEFLHVPLFTKLSRPKINCYANIDIVFEGCKEVNGTVDYQDVKAKITSKDGKSSATYECVQDVEHHGCDYNTGVKNSETKVEAFASCGILATE